MPYVNRVLLAGHVTRDPELRYTASATALVTLGLAINERVKKGEEWHDEPVFVDCVCWAKSAERAAEQLHKGSAVLVEGRLKLDSWQDKKTGEKRSKLTVTCEKWQSLEKRGRQEQSDEQAAAPSEEATPF